MSDQLSTEERWAIICLKKYAKWSQKRISTATNCSESQVSRTLKRYKGTKDVKNRAKSGRPPIISIVDPKNNLITTEIEKNRQITCTAIAENLNRDLNISVSASTIRRLRHILNYKSILYKICPKLSDKTKRQRLIYARKNANNAWSDVIFSDEKVFTLSNEGVKIWKRFDEVPIQIQQPLKPISLMVWGGVWMGGKTTIHITDDIIDADEYQNIIFEHVIAPEVDADKFLQQDNARPHKAKSTLEFFSEMDVKLLEDYPPYSPELNPIEKVWSWMSGAVRKKAPTTKEELMDAIDESWDELPQEIIKKYIIHLDTVCEKIKQSRGGSIIE